MKTVAKCIVVAALISTIATSAFGQMSGTMDSKKPGDKMMMSGSKMAPEKMSKKMKMTSKKKMMSSKMAMDMKSMKKKSPGTKMMDKKSMGSSTMKPSM